ncbi:carbohydrate binding domain-containing protein [Catenovulum adriaticum]|uniref:Carbohydrate binding domain-containing protein n=1 Tax=Catenovulum adriaticum TaxID=2984846 RepID=A0ABY7AQU4_9ALTE|nr:carbohydrate binding domain-containing protein [Catenovulum sp. TS8]WAJ71909.1 carbohydrate binding domain-containing protein [Catenovulum sp. TS8]
MNRFNLNKVLLVILASGALGACGIEKNNDTSAIKQGIEDGTQNIPNTAYSNDFEDGISYPWETRGSAIVVNTTGGKDSERALMVTSSDGNNQGAGIELVNQLSMNTQYGFSTWVKLSNIVDLAENGVVTVNAKVVARYEFPSAQEQYVEVVEPTKVADSWTQLAADFTTGVNGIDEAPTSVTVYVETDQTSAKFLIDNFTFTKPQGAQTSGGVTTAPPGSVFFDNFEDNDTSNWVSNSDSAVVTAVDDARVGDLALSISGRSSADDSLSIQLKNQLYSMVDSTNTENDESMPLEYGFNTWLKLGAPVSVGEGDEPVTATVLAKYTWMDGDDVVSTATTVVAPEQEITEEWMRVKTNYTVGVSGFEDEPSSIEFMIKSNYAESQLVIDEFYLADKFSSARPTGYAPYISENVYQEDFSDGDASDWQTTGTASVSVVDEPGTSNKVLSITDRTHFRDRAGVEVGGALTQMGSVYGFNASIKLANMPADTASARLLAKYTYPDPNDANATVEEFVVISDFKELSSDWLTFSTNYKAGIDSYDSSPSSIVLYVESDNTEADLLVDDLMFGEPIYGAATTGGTPISTVASIWVDAECAAHVGDYWLTESDELASGGNYVVIPNNSATADYPEDYTNPGLYPTFTDKKVHVDFKVNLTSDNAGDYEVYVRRQTAGGGDDSIFVAVNDDFNSGRHFFNHNASPTWGWASIGTYTFARGENTISFAPREKGFKLDSIYVGTSMPEGKGETGCNF